MSRTKVIVLTVTNHPVFILDGSPDDRKIRKEVKDTYGVQRNGTPHRWTAEVLKEGDKVLDLEWEIEELKEEYNRKSLEVTILKNYIDILERELKFSLAKLRKLERDYCLDCDEAHFDWVEFPPQKEDYEYAEAEIGKLSTPETRILTKPEF